MPKKFTKLSIILTTHNEGLMTHHTMLSVFRSLENFTDTYEIIIAIDDGDEATQNYFARYKDRADIKILTCNFNDAGLSRNFAIQESSGRFVVILDGDDLISGNYFTNTVETLEQAKCEIVVHPNYCLSFKDVDNEYVLQVLGESVEPETDAIMQFSRHRWISAIAATRETLVKFPYIATKDGFGHEDYALNTTLTNAGILHKIAKDTIYFYRKKPTSRLQQNNNDRVAQPYSALYDYKKWQKFRLIEPRKTVPKGRKQKLQEQYIRIRNNKFLNFFITPLAELAKKLTHKKLIDDPKEFQVPAVVLEEWKKIAKIENLIFPTQDTLAHTTEYCADLVGDLGKAYHKLCLQIKSRPDYIFIVPWIVPGGAEKVLLNYLKALQELHPNWRIAVITTLSATNTWKDRLPSNTFLVEFGQIAHNLSIDDRDILLTQTLIQLQCSKIHIINSTDALLWMARHRALVENNFHITASLFCYGLVTDTNGEGIWDIADPFITRVYPLIDKFYTDNTAVIDYLVHKEGYDREKFVVHYQPTPINESVKHHKKNSILRILWAGRISLQKNPKLLVRIANKLDPEKVQIDAYGRMDEQERDGFEFPEDSAVLHYRGPFQNFQDLQPDKYDLFLHTSIIDGMPNVVLEAASFGLITLAGNTGGVSDFVKDNRTGFLVDDAKNEDEYIVIINHLQQNPEAIYPMAQSAQTHLKNQYAWKPFLKSVQEAFQ